MRNILGGLTRELTILSQRKYITATIFIIVCTTSIFATLISHEVRNLQNYMGYIAENGKSALFHEEFINQDIAFRLSRAFSKQAASGVNGEEKAKLLCEHIEKVGAITGFNLVARTIVNLEGTLQTRNPDCEAWSRDVPALPVVNETETAASSKYTFSNYTGYTFNNTRYYIDLAHNYIYINHLVNTFDYAFSNWLVADKDGVNIVRSAHTITIDDRALEDLIHGENIVSHIYTDGYSRQNIISMITPVFLGGKIKGLLITDINIHDLATSFVTPDRPLLWKFLSLYVTDNTTGGNIIFHEPVVKSRDAINYQDDMTQYYTLHGKLDAIYVVIANIWLILLYILTTWLLVRYARQQFIRQKSLSRDNVTDAMTGLYNRKVITGELNQKIQSLVERNIPVTVIAIDSDGLKRINDTLGHHMGDKAIQSLGLALAQSIRKSDYGIRLGGDEFCLILIDNNLARSRDVITRVQGYLQTIDTEKMVAFSWGSYQMHAGDTLEVAMLKADELLYQHKRSKYEDRK
ncbi:diguanylate cyclase DgcJ [Lelliottia sp. V89_10]|uniref:diguanylate cyclase DgcJ n=1 Tax=Lelliottia wanjuensis TaxID=3050585 RepID=UPI00249F4C07|nr:MULTISPECIES: diguanylate cyclase DgcJ [unclassified Lelliottia]MDI3359795.1 diguanylate cyclase DgcJ [Lelliottia sp. V89_13]MDK9548753.1 diguanylate cyclase DgcJ [Lelliottia sp. V89_5]MDK9597385.1 diguanylate cyclase DgcJ [Lelliottia sp. V89_10]